MIHQFGHGKLRIKEYPDGTMDVHYKGTWPNCEDDDEVIIMRRKDLSLLVEADSVGLLATAEPMPEELFSRIDTNGQKQIPYFEDEMLYTGNDGTTHKLFLQHFVYTTHPKDEIWIRYCSVDQSLIEEQ